MKNHLFQLFFVVWIVLLHGTAFAGSTKLTPQGIEFPDGTTQTTATLIGPQGPEGPQGEQGEEGPEGPQGPMGTIENPVNNLEVEKPDSIDGIMASFTNISNINGARLLIKQGTEAWLVGQPYGLYDFSISYLMGGYLPGTEYLRIDTQGNVGIGESFPDYKLHVNGKVGATSFVNASSSEYKKNIQKLDESANPVMLEMIMKMIPSLYQYKEEFGGDGTTRLGFLAEDMPTWVLSNDGKRVDIYELLTMAIGAIQAQQKQIEELKRRVP